ncbi:MAG TPA: hypothetical protein VFN18_05625 [Solirubrobacterales bacterium]|nr:hypothetical protein [Solirubrobacterales bacterium]
MAPTPEERKRTLEDSVTVIEELDAAIPMICSGLGSLVQTPDRPRNLDVAMQNLAPGFERLLKLTYILAAAHLRGDRPDWRVLKGHSHDLSGLLDSLVELVADADGYATRPVVVADLEFLRSDEPMRSLLEVLSHFGKYGRYRRIDDLVKEQRVGADGEPSRRWEEIEQELVWARPDVDEIVDSMDLLTPATFETTAVLQRLARAITRMWTFGALGEENTIHYGVLSVFGRLDDDDLGQQLPSRPS